MAGGEDVGTAGVPLAVAHRDRERFRHLVDPQEMRSVFERVLPELAGRPLRVTGCSAKVRVPRSAVRERWLRVAYKVRFLLDDEEVERIVLGVSPFGPDFFGPELLERARALRGHPSTSPFRELVTHVPEHDLALMVFPLDPALPGLSEASGFAAAELLTQHLPECQRGARITDVKCELRHYKPFNRTVLRLTAALEEPDGGTGERSVYAKLFADDRGAEIDRNLRTLYEASRGCSALRVPEAIGYDPALRMMIMSESPGGRDTTEWIKCLEKGIPMPDGVDVGRLEKCLLVVADALEELQACGVQVPLTRTFQDELHQVGKDHELLADARLQEPELVACIERPLERLIDLAPDHEELVPAHGGFRHKQTVGDENTLAVIDWDGLCMASPALDPATFLVRLQQEPLRSPGAAPEMTRLANDFRNAFLERAPHVSRRQLALYEGLVLTERALRTFRRRGGSQTPLQIRRWAEAAEKALDVADGSSG